MFIEIQNSNLIEIITLTATMCLIFGHNLMLIGKNETAEKTKIEINTGDDFPSSESPINTERIAEFKVISENGEQKITDFAVENNSLTATVLEKPNTAFVANIELLPHPITLEADRFAHYIEDEDAHIFTTPKFVIGETLEPQRESYAKFAKVLVINNADDLTIFTKQIGQKLEIVLREIPNKTNDSWRVQVLFEGNPLKDLRVSSGAENLNGGKYAAHTRTDENGFAEVKSLQNDHCFIRTHYIRRHSDTENFEWESFWASVTFRV